MAIQLTLLIASLQALADCQDAAGNGADAASLRERQRQIQSELDDANRRIKKLEEQLAH
jgi:hypothetical protein